ncbi:MAG: hypothetical protein M0P91_09430 [Sulfuricurvum sp.]|jgi:3-dehydroquinate synthase|uniref:AroB-related putative sugar phosphate phospholyase (cyclizing) n=1 Tax=Sulfuricurvum sp. TaxID=2025608 RepID=UPI0025CCB450|nr:AroB-related putative sugar phosphate phospholyase (cyclizing) [Sulfuricurvum sp.]MCK9373408.1 hypothetical protein [Sulfuricurvum sp.]
MRELQIQSNIKNYTVSFEESFDFLASLGEIEHRSIIIDRNVAAFYHEVLHAVFSQEEIILLDAVEENKTLEYAGILIEQMIAQAAKKNLTLISIGGGITQDVTGFIASTLYRGVNWIFIPTTFLAQTDSCIGSKTSINFKSYKNLLGTFYPPSKIYVNPVFLQTLTPLDFYSGIGETIKFQLMKEEETKDFDQIVEIVERAKQDRTRLLPLIEENMGVKLSYMEGDEFDQGRRNLLNYGHCFGHALETVTEYYVPHGIAVTVGMIFANAISLGRGIMESDFFDRLNQNLFLPNIPLSLENSHFDSERLLMAMKNDKKRIGKALTVILPDVTFSMQKADDVREEEFDQALDITMKLLIGRTL